MKRFSVFLGFLGLFLCNSCSSDLDFNQANDLVLQPVVLANLASFDIAANQLVNNGTEQTVTLAATDFTALQDSFLNKNVVKIVMDFEVENSINRGFILNLAFLNQAASPVENLQLNVPPALLAKTIVKDSFVYEGNKLTQLKQAVKIGYVNTILPGPALSATSSGTLKLRSKATVYFDIQ